MADDLLTTMTDAQCKAETNRLASDLRDFLDRSKHPERPILRDSHAIEEAILAALGDKRIKHMFEYFFGYAGVGDEWLELSSGASDPDDDDLENAPEPNF